MLGALPLISMNMQVTVPLTATSQSGRWQLGFYHLSAKQIDAIMNRADEDDKFA